MLHCLTVTRHDTNKDVDFNFNFARFVQYYRYGYKLLLSTSFSSQAVLSATADVCAITSGEITDPAIIKTNLKKVCLLCFQTVYAFITHSLSFNYAQCSHCYHRAMTACLQCVASAMRLTWLDPTGMTQSIALADYEVGADTTVCDTIST